MARTRCLEPRRTSARGDWTPGRSPPTLSTCVSATCQAGIPFAVSAQLSPARVPNSDGCLAPRRRLAATPPIQAISLTRTSRGLRHMVYDIKSCATAETLRTIAARLNADIDFFAILHTWDQDPAAGERPGRCERMHWHLSYQRAFAPLDTRSLRVTFLTLKGASRRPSASWVGRLAIVLHRGRDVCARGICPIRPSCSDARRNHG